MIDQDAKPPGAWPAITALRGPVGVTLYQDARCGLSVAVPGEAVFRDPGKFVDASWGLFEYRALFRVRVIGAPADAPLAESVMKVARDVGKAAPFELHFGQLGVHTGARAIHDDGKKTTVVDVLGGGPTGGKLWIAVLTLSYDPRDPSTLDRVELDSTLGAIVGSAMFTDPVFYAVPPVFPESAWFAFDPPFALRYPLPPLPSAAPDVALADAILDVVANLPPARALDDARRGQVEALLAKAGRLDPEKAVLRSLARAHDVRGLARAIIIGS